jgi:putative ABC transport system permease protein
MHELRCAVRLFLRRPLLTLVVVTTLAAGLSAAIAAFAVVDQVLLRKPALGDPDRLVMVWEVSHKEPDERQLVAPADFHDLRASGAFSSAAAWMSWNFNLTGQGTPERLRGALVSEEFFKTLGREAIAGRNLPGQDSVVISYAVWQRIFGGAAGMAGRTITLDGEPVTVAGVMPKDFVFPDRETDVWTALVWGKHFQRDDRAGRNLRVIGRLAPGVSLSRAESMARTILARIAATSPSTHEGLTARVTSLHDEQTREVSTMLLAILAAAAGMLLIAAANVANLMLMLAASRVRELATRVALGGGRIRLLRQSTAEGLVIGGLAAMAGVGGAAVVLRAFSALVMPDRAIVLDARVLAAGILAALVAGMASTVIPGWLFTRTDLAGALRSSHQIAGTGGRLRNTLVIAQVALACALLVSAGVLAKSFLRLMSVDPGFDRRSVLTARVWLPGSYETSAEQQRFLEDVLARVRALPGVRSAATIQDLPLRGNAMTFELDVDPGHSPAKAAYRVVSDGYFDAMRIPLLRGRGFTAGDRASAPHVFVINNALARRAFAGKDPIGRRVRIGTDGAWGTIAGIAGDVKQMGLDEDEVPAIYEPAAQKMFDWLRWTTFVVRTDGPGDALAMPLAMPLRKAVMAVDPNQPVFEIVTLDDVLGTSVVKQRMSAWIVGAFGAAAFMIGLIGVGGVLSYAVALRTRELGVRLALGARPAEMVRLVLADCGRLLVPGVLAGLAIAVSLSPLLDRLLFRIAALDGSVYAAVTAAVLAAGALAAVVPARRAARIDPAQALSAE